MSTLSSSEANRERAIEEAFSDLAPPRLMQLRLLLRDLNQAMRYIERLEQKVAHQAELLEIIAPSSVEDHLQSSVNLAKAAMAGKELAEDLDE